jgi:excisionase family DNA binding protein
VDSGSSKKGVVPLRDRCWVSVDEASQVAGEGRTRIYELIALGKLLTKKVGRRRLVNVTLLLEYCGNE